MAKDAIFTKKQKADLNGLEDLIYLQRNMKFEELENLLVEGLKLPSTETRIFLYVMEKELATSNDICRGLDIQQSLVSKITASMIDQGILDRYARKQKEGRGRKAFVYKLAASKTATMNKFLEPKIEELRKSESMVTKVLLNTRRI